MADSSSITKLHAFNRKDTTYASDDISIGISVFVPKSAEKGQILPVLVRWHGGALINGGRVHEPWFPKWYVLSRIRGPLQDQQLSCPYYIVRTRTTAALQDSLERQSGFH
jgi:hypothetical protein